MIVIAITYIPLGYVDKHDLLVFMLLMTSDIASIIHNWIVFFVILYNYYLFLASSSLSSYRCIYFIVPYLVLYRDIFLYYHCNSAETV
jgi:hypothetical protein